MSNIIKPEILTDRMMSCDSLSPSKMQGRSGQLVPQGELFQVLGYRDGKQILKKIDHNLVVVGGAISALEALTTGTATWKPETLNEIHGVPATPVGPNRISLFGVGSGGSGLNFGSIVAPDIKQRDVIDPIPLRYRNSPITDADAGKYFMVKADTENEGFNSYYLKEFESDPTIKSCWKDSIVEGEDGTEITSAIYNSTRTEGIETFAEFNIHLNQSDVREYWEAKSQLDVARYNTIGFYTGAKNAEETEYGDVRLYSVLTFNNRDVSIATSVNFIYRLYALI